MNDRDVHYLTCFGFRIPNAIDKLWLLGNHSEFLEKAELYEFETKRQQYLHTAVKGGIYCRVCIFRRQKYDLVSALYDETLHH